MFGSFKEVDDFSFDVKEYKFLILAMILDSYLATFLSFMRTYERSDTYVYTKKS
jgi:hypothetical protein